MAVADRLRRRRHVGGGAVVILWHLPVLFAVFLGGLIAAAAGAVIGMLTIRLGDLYVGLVTLTFGLLVEDPLVFTRNRFSEGGLGVVLNRPRFANSDLDQQ